MKAKFSWRSKRCHIQAISKICCVMLLLVMAAVANAAEVEDFMPKESILYLKLQDIDEVYGEIEISENWEKALALLPDVPNWQEMQQGLSIFQGMLGTDLLGIIETVGYRTALAIWLEGANSSEIETGVVIHSGGNLDKLRQLTKLVEGFLGMAGENTLRLNAGVYQRVRYNAIEIPGGIAKYGFVDDFLVIGTGEGSFERLMDTYRTGMPSIRQNKEFDRALEETGSGEVVLYANVPPILSVMKNNIEESLGTRLAIFQSVFGRLNLLETGSLLQVAAQFNPDLPENEIGSFLREGQRLETLNALSVEDDLFVTVAPKVVESMWELVPTDDATEGIGFLEGMLNLNLEEDIMVGLTGELALSVPDFTRFDPEALSGFQFEFDGAIALDAGDVETDGGIIFNPKHRMKWNQVGNSISNLQNASVSQTNYKDETVSEVSSNIFHSEVDGLFLIGFSEEQVYALIDGIKQEKKPSYLKQLPKTPTAFAQLNLARVLEIENGSPPTDKLLVDSNEMALLLAWLSVEGDAALLEVTLSEEETPIEMIAKLVPFFLWNMDVEWE
ncbi:MAG: DUF3352 domain-containing protein [Candidatus Poribacteria bacterium]|nr:DUF3352 domain-containing protein [Candidatus Poribacteria bacterium]